MLPRKMLIVRSFDARTCRGSYDVPMPRMYSYFVFEVRPEIVEVVVQGIPFVYEMGLPS